MAILTERQMGDAARQMAHGVSRRALIDDFIDVVDIPADKTEQQTRDIISNELAAAQKGNPRYAKKFDSIYEAEQQILQLTYAEDYGAARRKIIESLKTLATQLQRDIELLDEALDDFVPTPTLATEYATIANLQMRKQDKQIEILTLLARITGCLSDTDDPLLSEVLK